MDENSEIKKVIGALEIISGGLERAQHAGVFNLQEAYSVFVALTCVSEFVSRQKENESEIS